MAITRTTTCIRVEVYKAHSSDADDADTNAGNPTVMAVYHDTFDDSTDDQLPVTTQRTVHLNRYVVTVADDGTETSTATDVTGEDQLVQDICGAIWTD